MSADNSHSVLAVAQSAPGAGAVGIAIATRLYDPAADASTGATVLSWTPAADAQAGVTLLTDLVLVPYTGGWQDSPKFTGGLVADMGVYTGAWPYDPPTLGHLPGDASEIDYYVCLPNPDGNVDHTLSNFYPTYYRDAYTSWDTVPGGSISSDTSFGPTGGAPDVDALPSGAHLYIAWYGFGTGVIPQPSVGPEALLPDAPDLPPYVAPEHIGLSPAVIALVAGGTANDGVDRLEEMDCEAVATFLASPGLPLDDVATSVTDAPTFALHTSAQLELLPPLAATTTEDPVVLRAVPGVTVELPTPVIVAGRPTLPVAWAQIASSATAIQGPSHIHAIADPDPRGDPVAGGWAYPPPPVVHHPTISGAGDARWTVRSMPNPDAFGGDFYWVGEPSVRDGTSHIASACRQWAPDPSTPGAPAWRSIYPYKPSIRKHVHYGAHGEHLTITAGMRFNLHFVEHMWLDWGHAESQPFTWVIAGLVMDYPSPGYRHTILDAGRDPRKDGVPYYGENQIQVDRAIHENLGYRSLLAVDRNSLYLESRTGHPFRTTFPNSAKARMFFGVFNGTRSMVGNYSPHGRYRHGGKIAGGAAHRHYVLGRQNGWLGLNHASHLVVFEIRFWHEALDAEELEGQYGQLSSTWRFHQYG